jgi:hypothetical protein
MKSLRHKSEQAPGPTHPPVLVADGGSPAALRHSRDPFEVLDDLMAVVEALCPTWPPREIGSPMRDLRL